MVRYRFIGLVCLFILFATQGYAQKMRNPHGHLRIDCGACHRTDAWKPLRAPLAFDHASMTDFPLLAAHASLSCQSCHKNLRFDQPQLTTESSCITCHEDVHQGTLGTDCQRCHNQQDFHQVDGLLIHAQTRFPLTGAHLQTNCSTCHRDSKQGLFSPLPTDCYTCHQQDYEGTAGTAVDHVALGFPKTCTSCHNTVSWSAATSFDHAAASGGFPLLGAHTRLSCQSCHRDDLSLLFPQPQDANDCYTCHQQDYQREHAGSGFPTNCLLCHNTNTWDDASFRDHDTQFFPIYSGKHRGTWSSCQTCHTDPNDFNVFTCLVCHEHSQDKMDREHREVAGYVYESTACYNCHPTGQKEGDD